MNKILKLTLQLFLRHNSKFARFKFQLNSRLALIQFYILRKGSMINPLKVVGH